MLAKDLIAKGAELQTLDAGGGWPINYGNEEKNHPPLQAYGQAIEEGIKRAGATQLGLSIQVEPGRSIVGPSGVLLSRVLLTKTQGDKLFTVLDAAMTELLRPALYQAYHPIWPVGESITQAKSVVTDVVGPVCETADFIALDRELPPLSEQTLVAIGNAGAYSSAMASNYNARRRPAEVLVHKSTFRTVRTRENYEDLWRLEST
ncbi:MAG: hypothetical protein IPJ88_16980 [Myxococcales bacterium]|nr:MAG: hypothetical protein IPJ88_16980 [Myxococcales bacterium]